jgi:hypothetical protein
MNTAQPGLLSLSHVAVRAADVERSVAFYHDVLGFDEASRLYHGDGALMLVNMRVSELQCIELFDPDGVCVQLVERVTPVDDQACVR